MGTDRDKKIQVKIMRKNLFCGVPPDDVRFRDEGADKAVVEAILKMVFEATCDEADQWWSREPKFPTKQSMEAQREKCRLRHEDEELIAQTGRSRFDINEDDARRVINMFDNHDKVIVLDRIKIQESRRARAKAWQKKEADLDALALLLTNVKPTVTDAGMGAEPCTKVNDGSEAASSAAATDPFEVLFSAATATTDPFDVLFSAHLQTK